MQSTLLGLLAAVLGVTEGSVHVLGRNLGTLSARQRDAFRSAHIGYIFQLFNLIPYVNVEDNILLPCRLRRERPVRLGGQSLQATGMAMAMRLGIVPLPRQQVTNLSVGEQPRPLGA